MIYDITPAIGPSLQVWPGDSPLSREVLLDMRRGDNLTLSTLRATVHLGAHADAPSHYAEDGASIDRRSLDYYLGPCQVIRVPAGPNAIVGVDDLTDCIREPRVLIATGTCPDLTVFREDFAAIASDLIDHLHRHGVRLLGIDTPSVDPFSSRALPAHRRILQFDMAILEGLVLKDVPGGVYELIALPLPLVGFDASPVRAVLRTVP